MNKILLIVTILPLLVIGCSNDSATLNQRIDDLEKENSQLEQQIKKDDDIIKQYEYSQRLQIDQNQMKLANEMYPWLNNEDWDEIIVSKAGSDRKITVKDSTIINNLYIFRFGKEINEELFLSDVEPYKFTLISGKEKHDIKVVTRNVVKIEDHYFTTFSETYKFGDAFFDIEKYQVPGNIETKIHNSGMVIGSEFNYPTISSFRMQGFAHVITKEGKLLFSKPYITTDLVMDFTFYHFGEKIKLYVYEDNIIQIKDSDNEYWYQIEDAKYKIPSILSAN